MMEFTEINNMYWLGMIMVDNLFTRIDLKDDLDPMELMGLQE